MLMVISCRIFKDILTFVDFTKHIYLLPQRTHRTITFFICCSKIFDSQGTELVNNEIAVRTGNLYGNFLSRFIFFIRFNFSLQCKHSIQAFLMSGQFCHFQFSQSNFVHCIPFDGAQLICVYYILVTKLINHSSVSLASSSLVLEACNGST